jgi:hypothetical protein
MAIVPVMMLASVQSDYAQQCVSTANTADVSVIHKPSLQASTTQQNCSGRRTEVVAWLDGLIWACSGSITDDGECIDTKDSGNAVTTAFDQAYVCGTWNGRSYHSYYDAGSPTSLGHRTTPLQGGTCGTSGDQCSAQEDQASCAALEPQCQWGASGCVATPGSPIIIAHGKNAKYELTSAEDGVLFDIDGDGVLDQVAWTKAGEEVAFLAVDRDGDGVITSGKELFGNYTVPGAPNGFDALQQLAMETNGGITRGSVSSEDPLFAQLLLWTDRNHNGISEPDELRPASEVLAEIGLGYKPSNRHDRYGNLFEYRGWAHMRTRPGRNRSESAQDSLERTRYIWDVYFKVLH